LIVKIYFVATQHLLTRKMYHLLSLKHRNEKSLVASIGVVPEQEIYRPNKPICSVEQIVFG